MFGFFKRKTSVRVVQRDPLKVRLHEWRADTNLTGAAMRMMQQPDFRRMLDCLVSEHPGNAVLPHDAALDTRAAHQARCEGYTQALANLEALAKYQPVAEPLESEFAEENPT